MPVSGDPLIFLEAFTYAEFQIVGPYTVICATVECQKDVACFREIVSGSQFFKDYGPAFVQTQFPVEVQTDGAVHCESW